VVYLLVIDGVAVVVVGSLLVIDGVAVMTGGVTVAVGVVFNSGQWCDSGGRWCIY
jgi:hypothetical protein